MSDVKSILWNLLIAYGGAVKSEGEEWGTDDYLSPKINYYGSCLEHDYQLTVTMFESLKEHGVDLGSMNEPRDGQGQVFAGTFAEENDYVYYLSGKLVTSNGDSCLWAVQTPKMSGSIQSVVRLMVNNQLTFEESLEKLEERLTSPQLKGYEDLFKHMCELPR